MTPTQKLAKIRKIYDNEVQHGSTHIRHNLEGAFTDMERTGFDKVCRQTLERVMRQLAQIEKVLGI